MRCSQENSRKAEKEKGKTQMHHSPFCGRLLETIHSLKRTTEKNPHLMGEIWLTDTEEKGLTILARYHILSLLYLICLLQ